MNDLGDVLRELAKLLEDMQVPYAVMGGLAVRAYAFPRPTYDVDFTVAAPQGKLSELFSRCAALGFTVPEIYATGYVDRVAEMPVVKLRLYLEGKGIDVDIFLVESRYQQELISRRRQDEVDGQIVWLVTAEDLILLKLVAARPRDIADIGDVFFMQGELDLPYMRNWAKELGVEERLEKALSDAKRA